MRAPESRGPKGTGGLGARGAEGERRFAERSTGDRNPGGPGVRRPWIWTREAGEQGFRRPGRATLVFRDRPPAGSGTAPLKRTRPRLRRLPGPRVLLLLLLLSRFSRVRVRATPQTAAQ